ncbi:MAG: protein kinase domain-containing protein, partial [Gemmatirosa sp.]
MQPTATPPLDPEIVALEAVLRGRFVVERELGRGGMGIVVLARDLALDRLVAIKVLPSPLSRQPHLRERFLREARTAAGLSHPNVVPIHAVEEHGDVVFFVMGFVDGETLARRVARGGPLPPAEATRVLRDVTWALAYAHGRGVIHRDVKPDNILLDRASGRALVTDFGIARVADAPSSLTLDGHVMGTAQYMSPEQAAGEAIDGRSDLYALGAVGFVALTGRPPFVAKSVPALLAMQVMQDAPPVVAPHLRNFVRMAEQSTMALTTMAPLMLVGIDARGRGSGAALGLLAAFIAIGAGLLRRARDLLLQGFGAGDVMRAFVLEQDARADEVAALYHGENGARLRRTRNVALAWGALLAVVWLFALAAANDAYPTPGTERTIARWIASIPLLLAMAALIVGVNSSERAERRSGALAGRLWRGRFTLYFFRLAGWGLDRPVAAPSGTAIDDGPSLPDVAVARHPELPRLLRDAHDNARALAEREARIVRVLAESGAADDGVPATGGPTTRAELVSRRVSLVAELRASLDAARA